MERRLKIRRVSLQIPELARLPFLFRLIPGRVESVAVRVQMRIRKPVHRPCSEVDELGPNHVAGCPVLVRSLLPHPCFDLRFNFPHRLIHRLLERIQNPLIPRELVNDRDRLWAMKIEIVSHDSIALVPLRQPFIRSRSPVLTQRIKCRLIYRS